MRDGWRTATIGEVTRYLPGKYLSKSDYIESGPYYVYGSNSIMGHHNTPLYTGPLVIVAAIGSNCGAVRYSRDSAWINNNAFGLKAQEHLLAAYVHIWLETQLNLATVRLGTGQPYISKPLFMAQPIQVPPLDEQCRIVDLISTVDEAIDAANKVVETARRARKALLSDLLSDERARREGWEVIGLGDCEAAGRIKLSRGHVISRSDIESSPGNYPVYSSSITNNGEFGRYGLYAFDEELITWSVDGGGNFFYRPRHKFSVTNVGGILKVLDPNINCAFLAFELQYLHSKLRFDYQFKAHPSVIRIAYTLMLPPLRVQQQIADLIKAVDDEIVVAEAVASRTRALRSALLSDLLSGQHEIPASYDEVLDLAA